MCRSSESRVDFKAAVQEMAQGGCQSFRMLQRRSLFEPEHGGGTFRVVKVRRLPFYHFNQRYPKRPDIHFASIRFVSDNFRSHLMKTGGLVYPSYLCAVCALPSKEFRLLCFSIVDDDPTWHRIQSQLQIERLRRKATGRGGCLRRTKFNMTLVIDQDVVAFDIPMYDPIRVKMSQPLKNFTTDSCHFAFKHSSTGDNVSKIPAIHVLHDDPYAIPPQIRLNVLNNIDMTPGRFSDHDFIQK